MSTNFIIDENYVITAVEIDGITHECSLQITSTWDPYLDGYVEDNGEIVCVMVGDKNNENNFVYDGTFSINGVDSEEYTGGITPAPEVNLVYMGTKYNYIRLGMVQYGLQTVLSVTRCGTQMVMDTLTTLSITFL